MSRFFTTARALLLRFIWKGCEPVPSYENVITGKLSKNPRLADVDRIEIAGQPHISPKDPELRVSGQIFKGPKRETSVHIYANGRVVYSKAELNASQED